MGKPLVGIVMGSDSDLRVMQEAAEVCREFGVEFELTIVSAHRTPERLAQYAQTAKERGIQVIVAGAGGAAHLPGMIAAYTILPVIGVPVKSSNSLDGWDSLLSIAQMPSGVPVATVAVNGARNAGIPAVQMLAISSPTLSAQLEKFKLELKTKVNKGIREVKIAGYPNEFDGE